MAFLDRIADDHPEPPAESALLHPSVAQVTEPAVPLFRARMIGLGFEPDRGLVLIELPRAGRGRGGRATTRSTTTTTATSRGSSPTRAQVRAMAARGSEAVQSGRPACPLCEFPMDPAGHICPRWN